MTKDELTAILIAHALWLAGNAKGKRANLSGANLSGANLSRANLSGADGIEAWRTTPLMMLLDQPGKIRAYKLVKADGVGPFTSPRWTGVYASGAKATGYS